VKERVLGLVLLAAVILIICGVCGIISDVVT
jgi:hypothetical protein